MAGSERTMLGFPLPVPLRKSRQMTQTRGPPLGERGNFGPRASGWIWLLAAGRATAPGRSMLAMCLTVCSIGSGAFDSADTGQWRVGALWSADDDDASGHPHWRVFEAQ